MAKKTEVLWSFSLFLENFSQNCHGCGLECNRNWPGKHLLDSFLPTTRLGLGSALGLWTRPCRDFRYLAICGLLIKLLHPFALADLGADGCPMVVYLGHRQVLSSMCPAHCPHPKRRRQQGEELPVNVNKQMQY